MVNKPKVLLIGTIDYAQEHWQKLGEVVETIECRAQNRAEFIQQCQSGTYDGVVAAYRTFMSVRITGPIDEELVNVLPTSWRYLSHCGAGYDQIQAEACSQRDPPLLVSNVPTAVDDATADTAIFLMLGALRNFNVSMQTLRRGEFRGKPGPDLGHDPRGKTLGILGMGGIGRNMAQKAAVFGMKTIYHNRRKLSDEKAGGAEYVSFDELLRRSDVLSLNLPLNKHTRYIISEKELKAMKQSCIIINTARGAVIDEAALVKALDDGQIAGAGLDVFEEEPKVHPGLIANEKVMLLPHMGTWTLETMKAMEEWTIDNVRMAVTEGRLKSIIPEQENMQ